MSMNRNLRTARNLTLALLGGLVAVAGAAAALPLGIDQRVTTPVGHIEAQADDQNARACIDARTPAVPALPVPALPTLPVPVPVAIPSADQIRGGFASCADAGLDGVDAEFGADAMGLEARTGATADTSEQAKTVKQAAGGVMGLFESIKGRVLSLF